MNFKYLIIPLFLSTFAFSCKDETKKEAEPIVPAETTATIEYNENQLDSVVAQKDENIFRGGGIDPFWTVEFSEGRIHFKAPNETLRSFVAPIPEPEISGNSKKYVAKSHKVIMEVLITEEACVAKSGKKNSHKVKLSIKPVADKDFSVYEGCGS